MLATLTTISKHVVRSRRAQSSPQLDTPSATQASPGEAAVPAAPPVPPSPTDDTMPARSQEILEAAILAEAEEPDGDTTGEAIALELSPPSSQPDWGATAGGESEPKEMLSTDLRIVSVGQADLDGEGGLRIPVVLGDAEGQTRSVLLSLRIDALPHDGGD